MVEVNRAGIARTARALGGEGTNVLLLKTAAPYDMGVLDAALPEDDGESPANGGWSAGPKGWMLLVEGLDEEVNPWIDGLAQALTDAGVEGTLTGAGVAVPPMWCRSMSVWARSLCAAIGFRTSVQPGYEGFRSRSGWTAGPAARSAVVTMGMRWLTAHDGRVMASTGHGASFWVDAATASTLLAEQIDENGIALGQSFDQSREDVRSVSTRSPSLMTLKSQSDACPWQQTVEELRAALLTAPWDLVSVAMVSYRDINSYFALDIPGGDAHDWMAYQNHPERWDEFVLEPNGIQVLTDRHLDHTSDLSGWRTTRLDADHVLVEARDLGPWYATSRRFYEIPDPDLMDRARCDFGDMILTPQRAAQLGL